MYPKVLILLACLSLLLIGPRNLFAEENPHTGGTSMMVWGIVTTAVAGGVGLTMVMYSGGEVYCDQETEEEREECEEDGLNDQNRQRQAGLGIAAVGAAIGVPLIVFGKRRKNAYNKWNEEHGIQDASLKSSEDLSLHIVADRNKNFLLSLSGQF